MLRFLPELHRNVWSAAQLNMVSIPNSWRETDLCGSIQAGSAFYNRIGNKISVRSVRWRGVLAGGSTELAASTSTIIG